MQNKEFTGVWIPRHILEDIRLKPVDRLVYAEIACFKECWQSNTTLAERSGTSEPTVKRSLKMLKDLGYIEHVSFDGRNRVLRALLDVPIAQNDTADSSKRASRVVNMTRQTAHSDPLDNKKITIRKQEVSTAKAEDVITKLYYEVIKAFGLPVRNHNNVKSAIAKMKTEADETNLVVYLEFMRDKYKDLQFDYKPEITEALDIYAKRMQITVALKRLVTKQNNGKALVI